MGRRDPAFGAVDSQRPIFQDAAPPLPQDNKIGTFVFFLLRLVIYHITPNLLATVLSLARPRLLLWSNGYEEPDFEFRRR